jgi:putative CocE/NonD family hydrolase
MRLIVAVLAIFAACFCPAQTVRMSVTFDGSPAGNVVYQRLPDNTFSSVAELNLGTLTISGKITGLYEGTKIVKYTAEAQNPGAPKVTNTYDHGKVTTNDGSETTTRTVDFASDLYLGNIHPQFVSAALQKVDFNKKEEQTLPVLFLEAAVVVPLKITPLDVRHLGQRTAKFFTLNIGPVSSKAALAEDGSVVVFDVPAQKLRFVAEGWEGLYSDPMAKFPELSQPLFKTKVETDVKMQTRDGVTLVSDIIRPDGPGPFPVILSRTPYGRAGNSAEGSFYATRGYVYVSQDCRGRGASGGDWDPFVNERKDGFDSVEWSAKLPYSNGKVGMIGASYGGYVQWAAAVEQPSALKCLVSQVPPPDAFRNLPYDMGVFFLYGNLWWAKIVRNKDADMSGIMGPLPHPEKLLTLPLSKVDDEVLGYDVPLYDRWLEREAMPQWKGFDFVKDLGRVEIPALHISGWWDGDEIGTQTIWASMRSLGRKNQWLIYGPWSHNFNTELKFKDVDYGPDATIELRPVYLRWFDTWLKGMDVKQSDVPKVQAFMTGANKWITSTDWPLAQSQTKKLYLSSQGSAKGFESTGMLLEKPSGSRPGSTYTYDPSKENIPDAILKMDPAESSTTIKKEDIDSENLTFRSLPFTETIGIGGPITLSLSFQTSARDTDFAATLLDIDESGTMRVFGKPGKIRASYLGGFDKRVLLTPGKTYQATIEFWDTLHEVPKGHRLGLLITSSLFPIFARNLGTGEPIKDATRMVVQKNTILHDAKNPSFITFQEVKR